MFLIRETELSRLLSRAAALPDKVYTKVATLLKKSLSTNFKALDDLNLYHSFHFHRRDRHNEASFHSLETKITKNEVSTVSYILSC